MKNLIFLVTIFILLILISGLVLAQKLKEDKLDIETSIVLLTLYDTIQEKIYQQDDFFEIFYFLEDDYILLPANLISPYLEVDLNFNRELSLLSLRKNQKEVRVDLQAKRYFGHSEWDDKPPVISGGEFYLCKEVFSFLTDYNISWNNSLQEVVVEGKFIEDIETDKDMEEDEEEKKEQIEEQQDILGEDISFQFSSIHYRIQLDLEDRFFGGLNKELEGDLNFYGRTGDWAYYINNDFNYNIDREKIDYELDKIKFKYQENNRLIIAGNHDLNFEKTIGRNELQGLYFSMPDQLSYKLIPYTSISVEAESGDLIEIYLNNNLIKRKEIKRDQEYKFENIELKAKYLNKIEVVKTNSKGEEERKVSYLSGSNDILDSGIKENEFLIGRYRDDDYSGEDWEGYLGGVRSSYALTKDLSLHLETAVFNKSLNPDSDLEDEIISSISGFAFRVAPNTVINIDWLSGGVSDNIENGAQAELLFSMLKGYIEGIYLYLPPEAAEYMEEEEGESKSVSFRLDLNNDFSIQPRIGQEKTLEDRIDETDYYIFKVIYNPNWRNYNALSFYYEENNEQGYIFSREFLREKIRKGLILENNIYRNTFRISSDLRYYENEADYSGSLIGRDEYQDYEAELGLYKRFNDYLLISLNYDGEQRRDDGGLRYYDREYNGQLRLSFADRASLSLESSRRKEEEEESEDRIDEETKLRLNYYFDREFSLTAEIKDYHSEFLSDYQSVSLSGNYYYPDNPGYIKLKGEYIVPDEGDPGTSFSAAYDIIRDNESEIKIEVGRDYSDFVNNEYESYATLSYSHALSFLGGKTRGSRFTDFEPRPIVAGYAYLDENYNGVMDPGERKLKDIPMRLGNMMAVSDRDGFFIFKPYFNDIYLLNFDYRNLIADYTPVTEEILVRVKDNQNVMQNFGVTINGTISGNVFIDKNANGVKDKDDDYLMWAGIEIAGLNKKDYTDQSGEYYFQNIPLGQHELVLLKESLPKGTRPLAGYTQDIFITEDQLDHHDIDIPIIYGD